LPELRIHYRTIGKPTRDKDGETNNAVLIMHGTTGNGSNFIRAEFSDVLFVKGGLLDASKYFIILRDGIGHGKSSKPSDGLHAKFPNYGYTDMVTADHRLLTEGLDVNHLRLVMGTSMGGMHTWVWCEQYSEFMDAAMPLACLPTEISGRNRVWRRTIIDAIRNDPDWNGGEYKTQPKSLRTAHQLLFFMGSNPLLRQKEMPTLRKADELLEADIDRRVKTSDANDVMYQVGASHDYNPGPGLKNIKAPLVAINFGDDLINPPELGILEREIKNVSRGRAVMIPLSSETRGHGSHTIAKLWREELSKLLEETEKK
jgi:homoserine O-acetyltransferase